MTRDAGSAAAEFALGAGLLALVAGLAIALGLFVFARTSAAHCATLGARAGALQAAAPAAAVATRGCLASGVPGGAWARVAADVDSVGPGRVVHVVVDLPVRLPASRNGLSRVHGHAPLEDR